MSDETGSREQSAGTSSPERVVVAGASGFLGVAVGEAFGASYELVGLSRSERDPGGGYTSFQKTDLFSLRDSNRALKGADRAIYLVHSMLPSARLMHGHFGDMDLLCANNFARAAARNGIREIIYVGGLVPDIEELSDHLKSRLEVEAALAATGIPVTTLRAGVIVGASGSSYQVIRRLVSRLPVMVCPSWTGTRMQPVALRDVVASIGHLLENPSTETRTFDLGAPNALSYRELMSATATSMGKKRIMLPVPLITPRLSSLWVTMTTGAPSSLIAPLIESLEHEMVVRPSARLEIPGYTPTSIEDMLAEAASKSADGEKQPVAKRAVPRAFQRYSEGRNPSVARSVARMELPEGANSIWAAREYLRWLPVAMKPLVRVQSGQSPDEVEFYSPLLARVLLKLEHASERSTPDRQIFTVTGGFLSRRPGHGRLEFRQVGTGRTLLATVHDFEPSLPWWIYRNTQAVLHEFVMRRFGSHLAGVKLTLPMETEEPLADFQSGDAPLPPPEPRQK
ncbi:MAG: NmrA family protein [Candidatus Binatia bacterium]|nr:NmrA family protein [Candidatus Binatia bacterium]MDG2008527.1 NmrA family protein [Candidatus Binatia bacterium]